MNEYKPDFSLSPEYSINLINQIENDRVKEDRRVRRRTLIKTICGTIVALIGTVAALVEIISFLSN